MQQLLRAFVEQLRLDQRTEDTVRRYRLIVDQFTAFLADRAPEADARLLGATDAEVHAFLKKATRTRSGSFSGHMWNQKLAAIRTLFGYLLSQELIEDDPTEGLRPVRVSSQGRVPLTLSEFVALLLAMSEEAEPFRSRNLALAQLGFHCGWRVQELHRLDLDHLDCLNRRIVNLMVKGKKFLTLTFPVTALRNLQEYLLHRDRFGPSPGERALFLSDRGTRLSVRQMEEIFPRYGQLAGIMRRVTPHVLRHSIATEHARRGTAPSDVQKLLNHESLTTTERYMHPPDSLALASDAIGADVDALLTALLQTSTVEPVLSASARSDTVPPSGVTLLPGSASVAPLGRGTDATA